MSDYFVFWRCISLWRRLLSLKYFRIQCFGHSQEFLCFHTKETGILGDCNLVLMWKDRFSSTCSWKYLQFLPLFKTDIALRRRIKCAMKKSHIFQRKMMKKARWNSWVCSVRCVLTNVWHRTCIKYSTPNLLLCHRYFIHRYIAVTKLIWIELNFHRNMALRKGFRGVTRAVSCKLWSLICYCWVGVEKK